MKKAYTVDYWGSHPDEDNDDCWTGFDFETKAEARAKFAAEIVDPYYAGDTAYVVMSGEDGTYEVRKNLTFQPTENDTSWRTEMAMQAGMAFGVAGYNDAMGY